MKLRANRDAGDAFLQMKFISMTRNEFQIIAKRYIPYEELAFDYFLAPN